MTGSNFCHFFALLYFFLLLVVACLKPHHSSMVRDGGGAPDSSAAKKRGAQLYGSRNYWKLLTLTKTPSERKNKRKREKKTSSVRDEGNLISGEKKISANFGGQVVHIKKIFFLSLLRRHTDETIILRSLLIYFFRCRRFLISNIEWNYVALQHVPLSGCSKGSQDFRIVIVIDFNLSSPYLVSRFS